jgi:hypothetical protein
MTAHDERQDDSPAVKLRFRLGPHHQRGIPILDDHTGQLVAMVGAHVPDAELISTLFVAAPNLAYVVRRARLQLRALALHEALPTDEGTLAVRQLLRELDDQLRMVTGRMSP